MRVSKATAAAACGQPAVAIVTEVVKNAFSYNRMGYASAMSWVLFVIIFVVTFVQLRLQKRWVYYESEELAHHDTYRTTDC